MKISPKLRKQTVLIDYAKYFVRAKERFGLPFQYGYWIITDMHRDANILYIEFKTFAIVNTAPHPKEAEYSLYYRDRLGYTFGVLSSSDYIATKPPYALQFQEL